MGDPSPPSYLRSLVEIEPSQSGPKCMGLELVDGGSIW